MRMVQEDLLHFTIHGNVKPDGDEEDIRFFFTKAIEEAKKQTPNEPVVIKITIPTTTNMLDEVLGFWLKLVEVDKVSIEIAASEKFLINMHNIGLNHFFQMSLYNVEQH